MTKKFQIIVSDPPWKFFDSLKMSDVPRGAEANYNTLTILDIQQLPVKSICDPSGTVLCLWVPSSLLQEGLDTMKAWGFTHKQTYVWVKTKKDPWKKIPKIFANLVTMSNRIKDGSVTSVKDYAKLLGPVLRGFAKLNTTLSFGMGRLFRQTHEICLIGISSNKIYKQLANKSQRSVCFAENLGHSSKPEALQDSLEIMFPASKKIELFARRERAGWTCLGNEVGSKEDIRVSLSKLINRRSA